MIGIIFSHNGEVIKFIGDAVLTVFNGTKVVSNHAEQAVRAALQICQEAQEEVHISLHTGPIYLTRIGHPQFNSLDIIGDTVNLAALMQRRFGPLGLAGRSVMVTQDVLEHCGAICETRFLEEYEPHTTRQKVPLYEVLRIKP